MPETLGGTAPGGARAPLGRLADRIAGLGGLARLLAAAAAGAAMTAGHPPVSIPWALFLALPALVLLIAAARGPWQAAAVGWAAGFGYFVSGLYWIGHAFLVDAERFAWAMPFAVTLLPAGLGLLWAGAAAVARRVGQPGPLGRAAVFVPALTLAEALRAHILTGFPWNLPGYVWIETPLMQGAALVGPHGMTFLTLAAGAAPGLLALAGRWRAAGAILAALAIGWGLGAWRLAEPPPPGPPGPVIRAVQPNAVQRLKWHPDYDALFYGRLLDGTRAPADPLLGAPQLIVWPETAVSFLPRESPERRAEIAAAAGGAPVVLGALHREVEGGRQLWFNSLVSILPDAELGPRYDKHHLVPFGEYLPLPGLFRAIGLTELAQHGGFATGPGPASMALPDLPAFGVLICYEMIFPAEVIAPGPRPGFLLHVTNDAWFGAFGGPQQHLAQARIRAIEQGLPVVRAANTGISAVIDGRGRVLAQLALDTHGHVDAVLPQVETRTLYSRTGDIPGLSLVLLILLAITLRKPHAPAG